MQFKWDSSVARDIANELNRLEQELSDCKTEVERCTAILRQMQGGELSQTIEGYISLTGKLKKGLTGLEEGFSKTGRGITRANDMFESNELSLRRRADGMGSGHAPGGEDVGWNGTPPLFYNIAGTIGTGPIGGLGLTPQPTIWPMLEGVQRTAVIDWSLPGGGVGMPLWLQNVIDGDYMEQRYH